MKFVLLAAGLFMSGSVLAESSAKLSEPKLKISLNHSQQEHGVMAVEFLGPAIGRWSRLGLNLGQSSYLVKNEVGKTEQLKALEKSLVWSMQSPIWGNEMGSGSESLQTAFALRVGENRYDDVDQGVVKQVRYSFFEYEFLFKLSHRTKDQSTDHFVKGSDIGFGLGFRDNLINNIKIIGSQQVDPLRIFPTLQIGFLLL